MVTDDYLKKVISYVNDPKFEKKIENPTHILRMTSAYCGDQNQIFMKIDDGIITEINYTNSGCPLNIASLELLCLKIKGMKLHQIDVEEILMYIRREFNGYPLEKEQCIDLAIDTLSEVGK